jgi:hypothetical protein
MSTSSVRYVNSKGQVLLGSRWAGQRVVVTIQDDTTALVAAADPTLGASGCSHLHTTVQAADETFYERRGCLDCNCWLDPVRLKNP